MISFLQCIIFEPIFYKWIHFMYIFDNLSVLSIYSEVLDLLNYLNWYDKIWNYNFFYY